MTDTQLQSRRALVTGASYGIGADFARDLAARGCNLVLVARNEARLLELAAEITAKHAVQIDFVVVDLAEPRAAERLFEQVSARGLEIDVLVNNAGVGLHGVFGEQSLDRIQEMLRLNIMTLTALTHLFLPKMRERRFGRIVQIGSIASYLAGPLYAAYSASKAYVLSFGESLNEELRGTGVSCTVVCPGMTATNFFEAAGDDKPSLYQRLVSMSSRDVARIGVRAALQGRSSVVTGLLNKIQVLGQMLMPRRLAYFIASQFVKVR